MSEILWLPLFLILPPNSSNRVFNVAARIPCRASECGSTTVVTGNSIIIHRSI